MIRPMRQHRHTVVYYIVNNKLLKGKKRYYWSKPHYPSPIAITHTSTNDSPFIFSKVWHFQALTSEEGNYVQKC